MITNMEKGWKSLRMVLCIKVIICDMKDFMSTVNPKALGDMHGRMDNFTKENG
jgi:hypothetical protein